MAKYFIDTEFLEGTQDKTIFGIKYGQTKPTIDLISIALVGEDGREYYAVSKDFNLKEAWNRFDLVNDYDVNGDLVENIKKVYWIRENVLKPIWKELMEKEHKELLGFDLDTDELDVVSMSYKYFKKLINKYGKTNKQIAREVVNFINSEPVKRTGTSITRRRLTQESIDNIRRGYLKPQFYGYFADYDWVVFCWLFGRMIDLPKGFQMYCVDLKQMLDERANKYVDDNLKEPIVSSDWHSDYCINELKRLPNYPKQTNEHNALADAMWSRELYKFLESL